MSIAKPPERKRRGTKMNRELSSHRIDNNFLTAQASKKAVRKASNTAEA